MIGLRSQLFWVKRVSILLAVVTFLAVAGYYLLLYRPMVAELDAAAGQIAAVEVELSRNEAAAQDLTAIKRDVVRLREQITHSRKLPATHELPGFVRDITALSAASNLKKFRYEPQSPRKLSLCGELPVLLTFEGQFPSVAAFLREAEQMPRLTRTRRLQIRSRDPQSGAADVQLSMSLYFAGTQ